MIAIRPATPADAAAMSAVLIDSITRLCLEDHKGNAEAIAAWTANKTPAMVLKMFDNPNVRLFVAERDDEIAAVGCLNGTDEIGLNYVAPTHRFMGVSRALLAAMEAIMQDSGVVHGKLFSSTTAREFYRTAGWVDVDGPLSGRLVAGYPMRKRLSAG